MSRSVAPDASALPVYKDFREVLSRYDGRSAAALCVLVLTQLAVGYCIRDKVARNPWIWHDGLLGFTWLFMTALLTWDIRPRRDVLLALAGLAGGFLIEWWGTTTRLWDYFTAERPPAWILTSWPVAALAIDRIGRLLTPLLPLVGDAALAYRLAMPAFIGAFGLFMWPAAAVPSSWVMNAIMLFTLFWRPRPERDMCIFFGGSFLGVFLERWGTSRHCWTYYTHQLPPPITALAHGYASIVFSRGVQLLEALWAGPAGRRGAAPSSRGSPGCA